MSAFGSWLGILILPLVLIFLGVLLFMLIRELLRLSRDKECPEFESNWGGLGRGLGGWRVNNMMVVVLFTLLILLMFGGVVYKLIPETSAAGGTSSATAGEPKPADAKPAELKTEQKPPATGTKPSEPKQEVTPPAAGPGKE
jgi:hypothetical protein